jgi:hypothetical protein
MMVQVRETAPPAVALDAQQRCALFETWSRVPPSGWHAACSLPVTPIVSASSETSTTEYSNV